MSRMPPTLAERSPLSYLLSPGPAYAKASAGKPAPRLSGFAFYLFPFAFLRPPIPDP